MEKMIMEDNYKIFAMLGNYLNEVSDIVTKEAIDEIVSCGVTDEYAFGVLLAAAYGLDIVENFNDRNLFNNYFTQMLRKLEVREYENNLYYKNIKFPSVKVGSSELKYESYQPFEGFVWNDIEKTKEGRQIPQIGFFNKEFRFPAVLENERIWMTVTPNEIETMKQPIEEAFGKVLTYGLGLGYFAYMVSEKATVANVTIVEMNDDVIQLFKKYILPQFKHADKITIIKADAFEYAQKQMANENYDFVFTDLWHDVSDGADMYLKMKLFEKRCPNTKFSYWIEKSILCYL